MSVQVESQSGHLQWLLPEIVLFQLHWKFESNRELQMNVFNVKFTVLRF